MSNLLRDIEHQKKEDMDANDENDKTNASEDQFDRTELFLAKVNAHITSQILGNHDKDTSSFFLHKDITFSKKSVDELAHLANKEGYDINNDKSNHKVPEDNVERLRNIRDMFENTRPEEDIELKKVEKLQPSEKLKQTFLNDSEYNFKQTILTMEVDNNRHKSINGDSPTVSNSELKIDPASLSASSVSSSIPSPSDDSLNHDRNNNRFEEGVVNDNQDEEDEGENDNEASDGIIRSKSTKKKQEIIPFAEMNNVKTKFEKIAIEDEMPATPKPVRSITPPREGADRVEIENKPLERSADVVSVYEKVEDALPDAGYIRSRKEIFDSFGSPQDSVTHEPRKKSITPLRDDILKRVLKEKTPERLDNVIRESDRNEDVLPSAGSIKQTAAIFTSGGANRQKSIERSGIVIEGELTEKGIAKSRLALFSDPNALSQTSAVSTTEQELDYIKNASGIAKERLNLFKNLEQNNGQRTSPEKNVKKFKEFTPPPQIEPRQYIIISKESSPSLDTLKDSYNKDEFIPESGLAKNRMKQYLDQASGSAGAAGANEASELQGMGLAKSMLAKWKSIENVKDGSPEPKRQGSPSEADIPQAGTAKSLLNKWQNIDSGKENKERKGPRAFTPPPPEEIARSKQSDDEEDSNNKAPVFEDELALLKGAAKNTLKKFEQSLAESNSKVARTVTPPREYIKQAAMAPVKSVFESQPLESNINTHYAEEEVIPPQGYAKNLKNKFLNLEKEAAKVETSSSKMNYVPKKFTSATSPAAQNKEQKPAPKPQQTVGKLNTSGLLTAVSNNNNNGQQTTEKCSICDKTVYAMEKIEADKKVYHKGCFKCTSCNCPLNLPSVEFHQNKPYCLQNCKAKSAQQKDLGVIVIDTSYATGGSTKSPRSPKSPQTTPSQKPSQATNSPKAAPTSSPKPAVNSPAQSQKTPSIATSQKSPALKSPVAKPASPAPATTANKSPRPK